MDRAGNVSALVESRDSMSFRELLAWAWSETAPVHTNSSNLIIHLFAVPLFLVGHLLLVAAAIAFSWRVAVVGLLCIVVSLALQGFGHSLEGRQVPPFTGPRDFTRRLYAEQFCNFWRFLFSGQWYAHLRSRNNQPSV
jgi:hypothetical protein